ncbi:SMP-30/gluconolactonase/LRE family protein [Streptomyces sp. NPDC051018]|uniref:SMP-30/gluconolactonase/LRE family protein n=1 Tax=Streptomyces sp. NPDC051018 TaxID=3365639 RepID=UPI003789F1BA
MSKPAPTLPSRPFTQSGKFTASAPSGPSRSSLGRFAVTAVTALALTGLYGSQAGAAPTGPATGGGARTADGPAPAPGSRADGASGADRGPRTVEGSHTDEGSRTAPGTDSGTRADSGAGPGAGDGSTVDTGSADRGSAGAGSADTGSRAREGCVLRASTARFLARLDLDAGRQPEGVAAEPGGSVVVTFAHARSIARVGPDGTVRVLATVPAPPPGSETPALGEPFLGGVVRADDGTLYFPYATGTPGLTGVWRLSPGAAAPRRVAPLPAASLPNGLALDPAARRLYVADSVGGTVWRVPLDGGRPERWSDDPALDPAPGEGFLGVSGVKVHNGSVWVTNHDRGTVLRLPLTGGRAGVPRTVAEGLGDVDDLLFTGRGDDFLVARVTDNSVDLVRGDGGRAPVLTARQGLQNPTALARLGSAVYVASSAAYTLTDPNVLRADLSR